MKIRTDFVTNSSSSSFCIEVEFKTDSNAVATMNLAVSSETCFSDDGDMTGEYISLHPDKEKGDVCFSKKSIYEISNIDELCDLLFSTATIEGWCNGEDEYEDLEEFEECVDKTFVVTGKLKYYSNREEIAKIIEDMGGIVSGTVSKKTDYLINNNIDSTSSKNTKAKELGVPIITELEFMKMFDTDPYYEEGGETVSVSDVAPKTIKKFKKQCKSNEITMQNLSTICIRNQKFGSGDSAMWVDCDNSVFAEYKHQYDNATKEEKEEIINKMFETVKKGIELPVNDNEYALSETMLCVWDSDDTLLRKSLENYLKGNLTGYWMATLSDEHNIDVATKKVFSREVLLFGDMHHD